VGFKSRQGGECGGRPELKTKQNKRLLAMGYRCDREFIPKKGKKGWDVWEKKSMKRKKDRRRACITTEICRQGGGKERKSESG